MFPCESCHFVLLRAHGLARAALRFHLALFAPPAVPHIVRHPEFPRHLGHWPIRFSCEPNRLGLNASVNGRRVVSGILTSNFMILPLMEVSMKSGKGQSESQGVTGGLYGGRKTGGQGQRGSGQVPSLLAEQWRGWSLMIFCARATRGLRRPSLDARKVKGSGVFS